MARRSDTSLAALLLVSRAVPSEIPPLKASEFWRLLGTVPDPAALLGLSADALAEAVGADLAPRVASLLDRATALAFEIERLAQSGIATLSPFDEGYPARFRARLGRAAPPLLHTAGPVSLLAGQAVGVVGSRDVSAEGAEVAREVGAAAARDGFTVASGGARGTDRLAMDAALAGGGTAVGLLADALVRAANDSSVRRAIGDETLCLATPYAPAAPFSAGNAMGRNKLVYARCDVTLVVASDLDKGGTWAGAVEALKHDYGRVAVWTGEGGGPGNAPLVERGAYPVTTAEEVVELATAPEEPARGDPPPADAVAQQLGLEL